jgi:hypothetical protein
MLFQPGRALRVVLFNRLGVDAAKVRVAAEHDREVDELRNAVDVPQAGDAAALGVVVALAGQTLLRSQGGYGICLNLLDLLLLTGKLTAPVVCRNTL